MLDFVLNNPFSNPLLNAALWLATLFITTGGIYVSSIYLLIQLGYTVPINPFKDNSNIE